jgi:hypothetical protein
MKRITIVFLFASVVLHAQQLPTEVVVTQMNTQVTVAAGDVEEPCVPMMLADRLEYGFEGSDNVDFNLHYYDKHSVFFPAQKKSVNQEQGVYFASGSRQYCMMWTNRTDAAVSLKYHYKVYRRGSVVPGGSGQ